MCQVEDLESWARNGAGLSPQGCPSKGQIPGQVGDNRSMSPTAERDGCPLARGSHL